MIKYILLIILLFPCSLLSWSQKQDYSLYHQSINEAEKQFFLNADADSALFYYDKAFSLYEFIFVRDLLNAAQIAYFSDKPYKKYLLRGFDFGLTISHLATIDLFEPVYTDLSKDTCLKTEYISRRKGYLKRIDAAYLLYTYTKGIHDQLDKLKPASAYDLEKKESIELWINKIRTSGFPGAKRIGIDDKSVFAEMGKPGLDIDSLKVKYSQKLSYFSADEDILASSFMIVMLLHNQCAFIELQSQLKDLILQGEIHPGEVGLLYDNMFRKINGSNYACKYPDPANGTFGLNLFCDYTKNRSTEAKTDELRAQWYLGPLAVDRVKQTYEKKYGFKLHYGYWGCE